VEVLRGGTEEGFSCRIYKELRDFSCVGSKVR